MATEESQLFPPTHIFLSLSLSFFYLQDTSSILSGLPPFFCPPPCNFLIQKDKAFGVSASSWLFIYNERASLMKLSAKAEKIALLEIKGDFFQLL